MKPESVKRFRKRLWASLAGINEFSASLRINQYERGKHIPDLLTMEKLASVLGVPVPYFFAEDEQLAELLMLLHSLARPDWAGVKEYIAQKVAANSKNSMPLK